MRLKLRLISKDNKPSCKQETSFNPEGRNIVDIDLEAEVIETGKMFETYETLVERTRLAFLERCSGLCEEKEYTEYINKALERFDKMLEIPGFFELLRLKLEERRLNELVTKEEEIEIIETRVRKGRKKKKEKEYIEPYR